MATWPRPVVLGPRFGLTFDCPKVTVPPTIRHTDPETYTYPYLRILKTFSGLPVTYVRTYQVSSWGRAYNSGLVDSTHFCLADEAVKEKTITQRCSMYVRPYVLISIWAKKPAQRSAGTRGAHPIRYRSAFQLFVLLPIPGGCFPWHRVE